MGQYANVTSRKLLQFLKWLGNHKKVDVKIGGNHPIKVTCQNSSESYPLPSSHIMVNKNIVKHFMEWLVKNDICTQQEFDERT